jgi:enoyl-CoA hydratase
MMPIRKHERGNGIAIEIHRPETLGALDTECFERIEEALEQARSSADCAWVAFFSRQPRGFCAGGDVRRLYRDHEATGRFELAERFFATEYRVDQLVWDFPKPVIALTHGITMGGGIGLVRGASHRVVAPDSMLAMPEISIGLYPDVGATFFLHPIPSPARELIAYCGARFGAPEALDWGLATHCIESSRTDEVLARLEEARWDGSPQDGRLATQLLESLSSPPGQRWARIPGPIAELFENSGKLSAAGIWDEAARLSHPLLSPLLSGSPISACVIHEQLQRGARLSRTQAFEWEFQLSMACLRSGDFFEGVRSRLVEKGSAPRWRYKHPAEVPSDLLASLLGHGRS